MFKIFFTSNSSALSTGFVNKSKGYGPSYNVFFNIANPKPINNPNN